MKRLALVTCSKLPEPDVDQELMVQELSAGFDVTVAAWDDSDVEWAGFDLALIRSTWNYFLHEKEFRSWISEVSSVTELVNSAEIVLPNIDKRYLSALDAAGIPIVPTRFLDGDLADALEETGWTDFVIKPTVSGGSYLTERFQIGAIDAAQVFLKRLEESHRAMVQPYIKSVEAGGEVSLIHIGGEFTHAIMKSPRFAGQDESVALLLDISDAQVDLAKRVLATVPEGWKYARVDIMRNSDESWMLSELELIEPSLFFLQNPDALQKLMVALK